MRLCPTVSRRTFIALGASAVASALLCAPRLMAAAPRLRVTRLELFPVRATARTVWLIVRLGTDAGVTGLGEASDAFGFANTTKADAARMETELRAFFGLIEGQSPFEIGVFRLRGEPLAVKGGLVAATAFSAIEQALWDLVGKALDVPTHTLLGGRLRQQLEVYANVNCATSPRTPAGFAATAQAAVREGFRPSRPRRSTVSRHPAHPPRRWTPRPSRASPALPRCARRSDPTSS